MQSLIEVVRGDITAQDVDAVVNAANTSLLGGGGAGESDLLASCHRRSLEVAHRLGARSVAFPAISCGIYGYPPELAAPVALGAVRGHELDLVRFVLFGDETYDAFARAAAL